MRICDTVRMIERALGERLPTQALEGFDYQQAVKATDALPPHGGGRATMNARNHPGLAYLSSPAYQATLATARQA